MNIQSLIRDVITWGTWYTDHNTGEKDIYVKISKAKELIKKLDEPWSVSIPMFVAEWIEQCKENATLLDCLKGYYDIRDNEIEDSEEFIEWVNDYDHQELVARAWLDGYKIIDCEQEE